MFEHLLDRGGALNFADTIKPLSQKRWTVECQQKLAKIDSDLNEQRDMALYHFKATGESDATVHEWEQKPTASKT